MTKNSLLESHRIERSGWLRAAVLGANDGIVSTASLIVGVATAQSSREAILVAGIAGLVAGAMSMAAGEYVSVSSQADIEKADLARETRELAENIEAERQELADIYQQRGLDPELSKKVAEQMMAHDALGAHARDELGITMHLSARPVQAAFASAGAFAFGAMVPLMAVVLLPASLLLGGIVLTTVCSLASLGMLGAYIGGAPILKAVWRVTFWGLVAMGATALVGALFGAVT